MKIFSVAIATGSHLFPFRTQQLSPSTSMVLLGRPCGRVESCRVKMNPSCENKRGFFVIAKGEAKSYDEFMKGYKFRNWGECCHRRLLTHREIYFASPKEFNDPFDCRIPPRYDLEDIDTLRNVLTSMRVTGLTGWNHAQIDAEVQEKIDLIKNPGRYEEWVTESCKIS